MTTRLTEDEVAEQQRLLHTYRRTLGIYVRQAGSVFGEQETAEMFVFDDKGLLVEQKTEIRKSVGK